MAATESSHWLPKQYRYLQTKLKKIMKTLWYDYKFQFVETWLWSEFFHMTNPWMRFPLQQFPRPKEDWFFNKFAQLDDKIQVIVFHKELSSLYIHGISFSECPSCLICNGRVREPVIFRSEGSIFTYYECFFCGQYHNATCICDTEINKKPKGDKKTELINTCSSDKAWHSVLFQLTRTISECYYVVSIKQPLH